MSEISGKDLVIEFGGTDISGKARSYEIAEDKGETAKIDVSHKGDTSVQQIEGLQGPDNSTINCTILYDDGGSDPVSALSMGDKQTLNCYPAGKTGGKDLNRLTDATLTSRTFTVPYDGAVEWSLTFNSINAVTYTTYTT